GAGWARTPRAPPSGRASRARPAGFPCARRQQARGRQPGTEADPRTCVLPLWVARVGVGSTLRDHGRSPHFFLGLLNTKMLRSPSCASRRPPGGSARRLACSAIARISASCLRSATRCRGCPGRGRRGGPAGGGGRGGGGGGGGGGG